MPDASKTSVRGSGATVQVESSRVVKRQAPDRSRIERERTQAGAVLGRETGLFRVPEIFSFDDERGEIVFERLPDLVSLHELLATNPDIDLLERAGASLAAIHRCRGVFENSDVTWHGDYGLGNLLYSKRSDELAIIDWSNAVWTGEPAARVRGPAALDLGIALLSLFHGRPGAHRRIANPRELGAIFLQSYAQGQPDFDRESLRDFMPDLLRRWRRFWLTRRGMLSTLAHAPAAVRLSSFVRSACTPEDR